MRCLPLFALLVALPAHAITVYTERAEWERAVADYTVDNLSSYPNQHIGEMGILQLGPTNFVALNDHGVIQVGNGVLNGDVHICEIGERGCPEWNDFRFASRTAFGLDVLLVDVDHDFYQGISFSVLGSETGVLDPQFLGWVSDRPFDRIRVRSLGDSAGYVVDNLSYGEPAETAVPELSTALLVGLSLVAFPALARRTNASPARA